MTMAVLDWILCPRAEHGGATRSHALRGNAVFDAPRRPVPAEGRRATWEAFPRRAWERVTRFPRYSILLRQVVCARFLIGQQLKSGENPRFRLVAS